MMIGQFFAAAAAELKAEAAGTVARQVFFPEFLALPGAPGPLALRARLNPLRQRRVS